MASVIVRKSDNLVMDASDLGNINFNPNDYDNLHPVTNPIPAGENPKKYMRDGVGDIVKRPVADLVKHFEDERTAVITTHLTTIQADPALLQATKDAIAGIIGALA